MRNYGDHFALSFPRARQVWRLVSILLVTLFFAVGCGPIGWMPPGERVAAATNDDGLGFNVDALGLDTAGRATLMQRIGGVRFGWIRQQVRWSAYEPTKGAFQNDYAAR